MRTLGLNRLITTYTARKVSVFGVFWSIFSCILTEYGDFLRKSPHSVRMRENMDQKKFEYGHFLRKDTNILWENVFTMNGFLGFYIKGSFLNFASDFNRI